MVIIELFVYVSIISMMVVCANVMRKRGLFKKLDFLYFCVLLTLIISQIIITALIFSPILPQIQDSNPPIILVCIGTILVLALIYFITRIAESSTEIQEYARVFALWAMFIALGMSFCAILIWLPETEMDLYRMPFALALCIGMAYYPPALERLKASRNSTEQRPEEHKETILDPATIGEEHKEAVFDIAAETNIEEHKEAVINLATESWRFAKVFERTLTELNVDQPKRYTSQLRWFVKNTEESLEDVGLRIVNVEGLPYDPGIAATPVNIEDFDVDDTLEVNLMIEPIIMEGTVLIKRGKVSLRRIEL